ncbi:hypothetical protein LDHU3_33.0660:CDS1 [Leishmania donovani]|uniref:Hypothetical_protein n=2 Tax=Leishmania donovani species complex TaxID=38574 RepID=A0A6L0XYD9_LEIIN|nr:hypothetical_protein [Leishmania infantum]CAJ1992007.1 hypothetical protein LDHU3_33.0660:CDS1 [Leishmania donovani]SUZ45039.1 hypothetical_protein [Leishmania infantum]VDZ47844.1 hypothetical_protein [Leishmania donovani]
MHQQQQGAALSSSHDAAPLQPHLPDESVEDSTSSVRIADGVSVMRANSMNSLFSFSPSGDFTWWSGTIPGLLACCALASMIIIGVCSSQRRAPAVLALMSAQQCSFLSSLQPPVAYMAWMNTCGAAHRGYAYPCMSQVDCVVLGPRCAPPSVLPQLLCVNTGARADHHPVCAYPTPSPTDAPKHSGFCTEPGTSCAICAAETCRSTTTLSGLVGCPPTSACNSDSWLCNPL